MELKQFKHKTMNILLAIIAGVLAVAGIIYFSRTKKSTTVKQTEKAGEGADQASIERSKIIYSILVQ